MSHLTLLWFRDDLRVTDHEALTAARRDGPVVALWIREQRDAHGLGPRPLGGATRWWAHRSLRVLEGELGRLGIPLLLAAGRAAEVLPAVAEGLQATAVRWSRRYAPASRALDRELKEQLSARGLQVHSHPGFLLAEPQRVLNGSGEHYKVFTPFWKAAAQMPIGEVLPEPAPQLAPDGLEDRIAGLRRDGAVIGLEELGLLDGTGTGSGAHAAEDVPQWWRGTLDQHWEPGCVDAARRLEDVGTGVDGYAQSRDIPGDELSTSRMSPRLRFGEVSPRQLVQAAREDGDLAEADREAWLRQVYWREFSWNFRYHVEDLEREPMRPQFRHFPSVPDEQSLRAWQRGLTGVPLVDAGMRQLWQSGWVHNRVRLVVGSFLTKNLLQPWWDGEQWFWDTLVDADEANNPVSWQWVAGCGADAAPYFRVFNPQTQRERFDPDGVYVRHWVPAALEPLSGYPEPIVDLQESRRHALDAYAAMKEVEPGRASTAWTGS
ncbi:deoxyribodipyrimidine photo-lyase [Citricoccus sp. NPDC079358]|uniref:cryptochrome/photolyase family protein n=1 Tax=Citricoccus sp. NPDC079358 TaxID=3154653 RepID=UPI00344FBC83